MRTKTDADKIRANNIRFPKRLYWKLQDLAHSRNKSLNDTVVIALDAYVRDAEVKWGDIEMSPETQIDIIREAHRMDRSLVVKTVAELESKQSGGAPKRRNKIATQGTSDLEEA